MFVGVTIRESDIDAAAWYVFCRYGACGVAQKVEGPTEASDIIKAHGEKPGHAQRMLGPTIYGQTTGSALMSVLGRDAEKMNLGSLEV